MIVGQNPCQTLRQLRYLELNAQVEEVIGFQEKPVHHLWVAMGVNALQKSVIDLIPKGQFYGFDSLLHQMLADKIRIRAFRFNGLWLDIGRPDDYERILQEFEIHKHAYLPEGA